MSLRDSIKQIIKAIPRQCYFDSHFVIEELLKHHTDEYINAVAPFAGEGKKRITLAAHAHIGQEILGCINGDNGGDALAKRVKNPDGNGADSWSTTIHGTGGRCALWRRI